MDAISLCNATAYVRVHKKTCGEAALSPPSKVVPSALQPARPARPRGAVRAYA